MGLEALVESYAFWRPSLRTLTFEDIPGIPKQGNILLCVLAKQMLMKIKLCASCFTDV